LVESMLYIGPSNACVHAWSFSIWAYAKY